MASEKINFRATPPLDGEIAARARPGEGAAGRVVQEMLGRYAALMAAELRTLRFTEAEFAALGEVLQGTLVDSTWMGQPQAALTMEIEDAVDDLTGQSAYPDLAARVAKMTPGQAAAVIDGIERVMIAWRADNGTPLVAQARQIGFRIIAD